MKRIAAGVTAALLLLSVSCTSQKGVNVTMDNTKKAQDSAGSADSAYLLTHFTGESEIGEQLYFALSKDGLNWHDTNGGKPVLVSSIGTKGVRDPFITKSRIDGKYYIIATDLRIANGYGWGAAVREGSTKMVIWSSEDLVHWSEPWTYDVPLSDIGCVWAPEAIYDEQRNNYLVFWASFTKTAGTDGKHIIYASQTTDFRTFTEPVRYIERPDHVIDTTIINVGGTYYRFSKDESANKSIIMDAGSDLLGTFTRVNSPSLDSIRGVEGPASYLLPDGTFCLMVDQFATGKGYLPLMTSDVAKAVFTPAAPGSYSMGGVKKRHGSVLAITADEYARLASAFGVAD
ncbi:MAG: glycoside hydrolase family 43 protein [Treponema sp.]|nr:glycoside hydrolase family 43 protein [Treponema sp.]